MPTTNKPDYDRDGYLVHDALTTGRARDLGSRIEHDIDAMSADLGVSRSLYLSAVCRWSTPNPRVQSLLDDIVECLRPQACALLGGPVHAGRASVFRQSEASRFGTHAHQDAGYWGRPSSRRYDATTWVTLDDVDATGGALRVLPGSHREEVTAPVDYLATGFVDPADAWGPEARTLGLCAGNAVTFGPRLWHASHRCVGGRLRRALAVRWVIDSSRPASTEVAVPPPGDGFGMYTAGEWLHVALRKLGGEVLPRGQPAIERVLALNLVASLPHPEQARAALVRLLVYQRAAAQHHAAEQRGMVWEAVHDFVIAPVVGNAPAPGGD